MDLGYTIGNRVMQIENKVIGEVIKMYYPTACKQQTMILCDDRRKYHAPSDTFVKVLQFEDDTDIETSLNPISIDYNYVGTMNDIERYRNLVLQKCNVHMR